MAVIYILARRDCSSMLGGIFNSAFTQISQNLFSRILIFASLLFRMNQLLTNYVSAELKIPPSVSLGARRNFKFRLHTYIAKFIFTYFNFRKSSISYELAVDKLRVGGIKNSAERGFRRAGTVITL